MKKIILFIMVVVFVINSHCFNVRAAEGAYDVSEDTSKYDELNDYLVEHGREVLNRLGWARDGQITIGNIKRLVQTDSRWKNEIMQTCGATIGGAGCCLTSFTIVRNFLSITSDTPSDVNTKLGSYACPFNWTEAASLYDYNIVTAISDNSGISNERAKLNIIGAIDEYNLPTIVGVTKADGGTHFVVAYGYTLEGDIVICDPASRNYTRLSQYYNEGCFVHRLYVYSK